MADQYKNRTAEQVLSLLRTALNDTDAPLVKAVVEREQGKTTYTVTLDTAE